VTIKLIDMETVVLSCGGCKVSGTGAVCRVKSKHGAPQIAEGTWDGEANVLACSVPKVSVYAGALIRRRTLLARHTRVCITRRFTFPRACVSPNRKGPRDARHGL
jgi:hypothetical protein